MTIATTTPTIENYLTVLRAKGDVQVFIDECFGTDLDFDNVACDAFAESVQAANEEYLRATVEAAEEAPADLVPTEANEGAVAGQSETMEGSNDTSDSEEVAVEAPVQS